MRFIIGTALAIASLAACDMPGEEVVKPLEGTFADPAVAIPGNTVALTSGDMLDAVAVSPPNDVLVQPIKACAPFEGLSLTVVTWTKAPSAYALHWKLKDAAGAEVGGNQFDTGTLVDWQKLSLPVKGAAGDYTLELSASGETPRNLVGVIVAKPEVEVSPASRNSNALNVPGALQAWIVGPEAVACVAPPPPAPEPAPALVEPEPAPVVPAPQ